MQAGRRSLTLTLGAFTLEEVGSMVGAVLDTEKRPEKLAQVVWEMTAGWPLYAEQVGASTVRTITPYAVRNRQIILLISQRSCC